MQHPTPGPAPAVEPTPVRARLRGIDMARGLAILGMAMVHMGPQELPGGGLPGAAFRSSHGRASILFIVLAGVGVSLLAGDRSGQRVEAATKTLWWRALLLLPMGLALQALPVNVAVILQYYAVYFAIASLLLRLDDAWLVAVAMAGGTAGPVLIVWLQRTAPELFLAGVPAWNDVVRIVRDILVTGYYPAVVWVAPLAVGMWIGRRDLRAPGAGPRLLAWGAATAAAGFVLSAVLVGTFGAPAGEGDWRQLAAIEPHNEMPLWVLTATAIAVAILGLCLLLARLLPRLIWPLAAYGQLALTVYVTHVVLLAVQPAWFLRDTFPDAWGTVARFALVSIALATAYRAVAPRGPFEVLLRAPARSQGQVAVPR